jgi:uncharacterized FAD-dependent dehydrogenase
MVQEYQIRVQPQTAYNEQNLVSYLSKEKGFDARTINRVRILRRSIDARQRQVMVNLKVRVYINEVPQDDEYQRVEYPNVADAPQVIVVGAGPGGLFAALHLIELGYRPVIVERGKDVRERKKDMAAISRNQCVDPESNYCFGEGGAGAYSDGKLYTRSKKRGSVEKILNIFCQHGASTSILCDAHPHIGTDKLPRVIENMRKQILQSGGQVYFNTKMTELLIEKEHVVGIRAVNHIDNREIELQGPVILATGHSARDVYRYLNDQHIEIAAKGIAVGVRLEHPAELIDQIQYHSRNGRGKYLPAAEYSFVTQVEGRGVYSFCMCPGGFIIPAATGPEQIVVNGMSPSNRGTRWSNSGMVVEVHPEDLAEIERGGTAADNSHTDEAQGMDPLCMMHFQERLEKDCWQQGNRKQTAPAQRMADFVNGHLSYDLPESSYAPGLVSSPLHFWMPPFIAHRLQEGFKVFGRQRHGFLTNEATLIATETRTSSPVRILRDDLTLQHIRLHGLFPCGEGAGYAGGIVSAAIDGERCADMAVQYLQQ